MPTNLVVFVPLKVVPRFTSDETNTTTIRSSALGQRQVSIVVEWFRRICTKMNDCGKKGRKYTRKENRSRGSRFLFFCDVCGAQTHVVPLTDHMVTYAVEDAACLNPKSEFLTLIGMHK